MDSSVLVRPGKYGEPKRLSAVMARVEGSASSLAVRVRSPVTRVQAGPVGQQWCAASAAHVAERPSENGHRRPRHRHLTNGRRDNRFGDGAFHAFQGLAHFLDGQWGRASISFNLARAGQSKYPAPMTSSLLPLAAVISGDAQRTREEREEARRIGVQSPQPAAVNAGKLTEVFALKFPRTDAEREQWLDRRTADFGDPFCS